MNDAIDLNMSSINHINTANNNVTLELNDIDSHGKVSTNIINCGNIDLQPTLTSNSNSNGYYDAEKCRTYIANQIKINKINRFALQIGGASEIETSNQIRLENLINMFTKCSSKVMHDFTMRCKLGLQSHRQDRILNYKRKKSPTFKSGKQNNSSKTNKIHRCNQQRNYHSSISNDLLYGAGAQLVRALLSSSSETISIENQQVKQKNNSKNSSGGTTIEIEDKFRKDKTDYINNAEINKISVLSDDDYLLSDYFEPKLFVKMMEDLLRANVIKSKAIDAKLSKISQVFESLALKHRDKVDKVYTAEEERQAASVTRRSAYNLSVAAIKATSTPVHINTNLND